MASQPFTSTTDNRPLSENAAVIDAVKELAEVQRIELDANEGGVEVLAVPVGKKLVSTKPFLDEYLDAPERRRGTARLTTLASFVEHVKRFSDEHSALFADDNLSTPKLVGVLNYHESKTGSPRFGDHRAQYEFPLSDEWKVWTRTEPMQQGAFAEFVEDHIGDVLDPSKAGAGTLGFVEQLEIVLATPAQLMTLSKGLSVYVDAKVSNKINPSTGEGQLSFSTEHRDVSGAPLKVPRGFAVGIPVFTGGERYSLPIRLRYRVVGDRVVWELKPHRVELAFRHAVTEACNAAREQTGLPLFYGVPEAG